MLRALLRSRSITTSATSSDELFQFCRTQPLLRQVAKIELESPLLEKSADLLAGRAIGLVKKLYGFPFSPARGRSARLLRRHLGLPHEFRGRGGLETVLSMLRAPILPRFAHVYKQEFAEYG